jgi:hypothetical protein
MKACRLVPSATRASKAFLLLAASRMLHSIPGLRMVGSAWVHCLRIAPLQPCAADTATSAYMMRRNGYMAACAVVLHRRYCMRSISAAAAAAAAAVMLPPLLLQHRIAAGGFPDTPVQKS